MLLENDILEHYIFLIGLFRSRIQTQLLMTWLQMLCIIMNPILGFGNADVKPKFLLHEMCFRYFPFQSFFGQQLIKNTLEVYTSMKHNRKE